MVRSIKTKALILKKRTLLDKDILVTLFSQERGKLHVLAKGVKKITSRRLPHIQTGNISEVILQDRNQRLYLQESRLISHLTKIKEDKQKVSMLYFTLFILDRLLPENQKEQEVYNKTLRFLVNLSKESLTNERVVYFLNDLLQTFGYSEKTLPLSEIIEQIQEITREKLPVLSI